MRHFLTAFLIAAATATVLHAGDVHVGSTSDPHVLPIFEIQSDPIEIDIGAVQNSFALESFFKAEPIDDNVVRFTAQYDDGTSLVTRNLDMALFSSRTPITRANFLEYVANDAYIDSFIHRSAINFVIQGGGFQLVETPDGPQPVAVPTNDPIVNEPGISNTLGTISMAKTALSPDTATSQWFVSTAANSSNLDYQNGGFTVFARITKETLPNALLFNNPGEFPIYDLNGPFNSTPLHKSVQFLAAEKFIIFTDVGLVPLPAGQAGTNTTLTHAITSQPSPSLATASIDGDHLVFTPSGSNTGSGNITIKATDSVGNDVIGTIPIFVGTSYTTWRNANFSGDDLTDDSISGPDAVPFNNGIPNFQAFAQGLDPGENVQPVTIINPTDVRITYLEQTDVINTRISIQRSTTLLADDWTTVPTTLVSSINTSKPKQKSTTVSVPKSGDKAFYRIVFESRS